MRQFYLLNGNGNKYDVTVKNDAFLHSVSGLGYAEENEYRRLGSRFQLLRNRYAQSKIIGSVHFVGQKNYQDFVKFCQIKPITMVYKPINKEYRCNGTVSLIGYDETNTKTVSFEFTPFSMFYEDVAVVTYPSSGQTEGKIYNYKYPYQYSSANENTVVLNLDTAIESPCKLTIYGPVTNPTWRHYVNGELVATGGITGSIVSGNRLEIDTTGDAFTMIQYDALNNVVADMYQASDFGTIRAIYLRYGKNSIVVEDDNASKVTVAAEGNIYYAGV